jgi:hypothetical protein
MLVHYVLISLAVVVALFLVAVAMQPAKFQIQRSAVFSCSPPAAFSQVNDFHKWEAWSPWAKMDPACKNQFSGALAGTGAMFHWDGNKKVGEGKMTIVESKPSAFIRIKLEFLKPFVATNIAEFTFEPRGDQTAVNWSMTGERNFIFKAMCMFMNMDKIVGGEFEKGLADMKKLAEATRPA